MTQEITQKKSDPVADFIGTLSGGWAKVLPNVCTPKRFARVAITCMKKIPNFWKPCKPAKASGRWRKRSCAAPNSASNRTADALI